MNSRFCFGYGSLVNRHTHGYHAIEHAELSGWKRSWTHRVETANRNVSSLSLVPAKESKIKGLVVEIEPHKIEELDAREAGYSLEGVTLDHLGPHAPPMPIHTYVSRNGKTGDANFPILQSYLDTVLSGFLKEFGTEGITHFIETTEGWDTPIFPDRAAPRYPRATKLSEEDAILFDGYLSDHGVNFQTQPK